jgi:hypothetical protein
MVEITKFRIIKCRMEFEKKLRYRCAGVRGEYLEVRNPPPPPFL